MRRGDEVVFRVSSEPGLNWVRRVIALPGDTVEVKDDEVFVNGRQLPREPAPRASLGAAAQVVKGELFEETNAGRRYRILFATDTKPLPPLSQPLLHSLLHERRILLDVLPRFSVTPKQGKDKGKVFKGLLILEENLLKLCLARPGDDRPTEASSHEGSGHILLVLEPAKSER